MPRRTPTSPAALKAPPADQSESPRSPAEAWFAGRGWVPFDFQREVWAAMAAGRSGLLHATTGSGKTYAVWMGALQRRFTGPGLQVLWITPMRALAADTARALQAPLDQIAPEWTVGLRTGDTPSAERARQERRWPAALVTTPESLSLLLTREEASTLLGSVHTVVIDEWHELLGSKRGVQVQLALARLRRWNPGLITWGLSATLGNLADAMHALVGAAHPHDDDVAASEGGDPGEPGREGGTGSRDTLVTSGKAPCLVQGRVDKTLVIDTLLPPEPGRFSWGGHLGAQMLEPVVQEIERASTTLVFTNVRSQAEIWYQLLLQQRPQWAGLVALHHGSLDASVRAWVEAGLKHGRLKAVVATSSLDLGVDFLPVERVLQIGSAKGVARLLQRAGRSGHAPGRPSRITLVPTNTLELVEAVAARRAAQAGRVESRRAPDKPLDVLVQHLVTVALGGGFEADTTAPGGLFDEIRSAPAYSTLTREEFDWALRFCERGGDSLTAYPDYHRIGLIDGRWRVPDRAIARRHRMQVGTIVADATMAVKWLSGGTLGTTEEGFIARLQPGDCFVFAGRVLEYVRTRDMAAYVRLATRGKGIVPTWAGGRMPLSSELAQSVREVLDAVAADHDGGMPAAGDTSVGHGAGSKGRDLGGPRSEREPSVIDPPGESWASKTPEVQVATPMLQAQSRLSRIPAVDMLLIERYHSREGHHLFVYPFAGRQIHIGLAQLFAWRLARAAPNTFSLSVNDYGLEILAAKPVDVGAFEDGSILAEDGLMADVLASLNTGELAQRRFREIARVAGLVFSGYPGAPKSTKQLQASAGLFFEVFRKYDPANRLLTQAEQEVLSQELEISRLAQTLNALAERRRVWVTLAAPSPFALPLMIERLREQLSTEKLQDRLDRLLAQSEAALASGPNPRQAGGRRSR